MGINLKKRFYSNKEIRNNFDLDFDQLNPITDSIQRFFKLYEENFYNIPDSLHDHFLKKSIEYTYPEKGYVNTRQIELNDLKDQINQITTQIDSIERVHPYFKNGSFLMDKSFQIDNNVVGGIREGNSFYIQSAHKRQILNSSTYYDLKNKSRLRLDQLENTPISDEDFIIFISKNALGNLPVGPPISSADDIYIPTLEINRYNPASNDRGIENSTIISNNLY